jgi:hypothetical protein
MDRLLIAVALAAVAVGVALLLQRRDRRPARPPGAYEAPEGLVRSDFVRPDAPWLVVVFTSRTCDTCAGVWERAGPLESTEVAVQEVEVTEAPDLHARYGIAAVPITCVADAAGDVVASFVGPVSSTHLWAAVAEARTPGSVPPGCAADGDGAGGDLEDHDAPGHHT